MDNKTTVVGVDIAKTVFESAVSGVPGRVIQTRRLVRAKFVPFFVELPPAIIVMEVCGSAHYWGGEFETGVQILCSAALCFGGGDCRERLTSREDLECDVIYDLAPPDMALCSRDPADLAFKERSSMIELQQVSKPFQADGRDHRRPAALSI